MYLSKLLQALPKYLDKISTDKGSGAYAVMNRVAAFKGTEYFVEHMMDVFVNTEDFGMHTQFYVLDHKIPITSPDEGIVISTTMPNRVQKGVPCVIVGDHLGKGLYIITNWLGVGDTWASSPAIAVFSAHKKLSDCSNEEKALVTKVFGDSISKQIFVKEGMYGIIPLSEKVEDLDWVDTGTDLFLRFLLIKQIPGIETISPEGKPYKQVVTTHGEILGEKNYSVSSQDLEDLRDGDPGYEKGMALDILPNVIGFADQAIEELGSTPKEI